MQLLRPPSPAVDAGPSPAPRPIPRAFSQAVAGLFSPGSSSPPITAPGTATIAPLIVPPTPRQREALRARAPQQAPKTTRAYACRCLAAVSFDDSECPACHTQLGYAPAAGLLLPLEPVPRSLGRWRRAGAAGATPRFHRCANFESAAACNWLVDAADAPAGKRPLCRSCRLTRTPPDARLALATPAWGRFEQAKRRLVGSLLALGLPLQSSAEDPVRGLCFDLLPAVSGGPPVHTGPADGVVMVDVEAADDADASMLGQLRHASGHHYWHRLVQGSHWLEAFRELFGDERTDDASTRRSHPQDDWAQTWADYLHLRDTLDTAQSFGLNGPGVQAPRGRFVPETLGTTIDPCAGEFLQLIERWTELSGALNELSRSMGLRVPYPSAPSPAAVRKLHLVHRIVAAAAQEKQT